MAYIVDANGVKRQVTLRELYTPLGVRRLLSGNVNGSSTSTPTPPVDPNPPSGGGGDLPLMIVYPGPGRTTDSITASLGQAPQGWCVYVQRPQLSTMVGLLSPYARAGLHLHIGCGAPNDKPPNYPNGSLELMKGLGDRSAFALDFWTTFCQNMQTVAKVNPNVKVKVAPIVEPETGFMQTGHASTSSSYGEPTSGATGRPLTLAAFGRFYTEFYKLMAEHAPACIRTMWLGGSLGRNVERNAMFAPIPDANGPQEIVTDPYNNNLNLAHRAVDTWRPHVDNWRLTTGAHYSHWSRWGKPPIGLGETGIDKLAYTQAQMLPWLESMYDGAVALNLTQVNYFNSSGPNGNQQILGTAGYEQATATFSGEITQAKQALAAAP